MTTFSGSFSTDESGRIKEDIFQDLVEQDLGSPISLIDQIALGRGRPDRSGEISMDLSGDDPSGGVYDPSRMAALRSIANMQTGGDPSISQPPDYTTPSMKNFRSLVPGGLASIPNVKNIESGYPMMFSDPTGGLSTRGSPRDSFAARDVAIDQIANMNPVVKGIHNAYAKMFGLGMDDQGNITPEALIDLKRQTQQTIARDQELGDDRRKDQEERERAALLAAQNQPVDPCPEGYRLDPMSKVCVPTDDTTTDTAPGTGRVYETMTKPQENYTAATNFNVPAINLPDIFTGN